MIPLLWIIEKLLGLILGYIFLAIEEKQIKFLLKYSLKVIQYQNVLLYIFLTLFCFNIFLDFLRIIKKIEDKKLKKVQMFLNKTTVFLLLLISIQIKIIFLITKIKEKKFKHQLKTLAKQIRKENGEKTPSESTQDFINKQHKELIENIEKFQQFHWKDNKEYEKYLKIWKDSFEETIRPIREEEEK
jgi:hypothetical protein